MEDCEAIDDMYGRMQVRFNGFKISR